MKIEAIYDRGRLEFVRALRLKHDRVRVVVTVPDEEVESEPAPLELAQDVLDRAQQMRARLDAVLNAPLPADEELPALTGKQQERIRAFALREDR